MLYYQDKIIVFSWRNKRSGSQNVNSDPSFKLSVIILVLKERETLRQIMKRIQTLPYQTEIIIVDDGSSDGTRDLLDKITVPNIRIFMHENNLNEI